jgi:hypothetical protein
MLKPRSRKPVEIPSVPPAGHGDGSGGSVRPAMTSAADVVARAGRLLRPRGGRGTAHRRFVDPRAGGSPSWDAGPDDGAEVPWSTFRGATARFVAFG